MRIPGQACWIVNKIIEAPDTLQHIQVTPRFGRSFIRQLYLLLLGNLEMVNRKCLVFQNAARTSQVDNVVANARKSSHSGQVDQVGHECGY